MQNFKWIPFLILALFCFHLNAEASCVFKRELAAQELEIGIMLNWSTSNETNQNFFLIQRSDDGKYFYTLGKVDGNGGEDKINEYQFLDVSTGSEQAFYRLQVLDKKGSNTITPPIMIVRKVSNNMLITNILSTRIRDYFTGTLQSAVNGRIEFEIQDLDGNPVRKGEMGIFKGENKLGISMEKIPAGSYKLFLKMNDEKETVILEKII